MVRTWSSRAPAMQPVPKLLKEDIIIYYLMKDIFLRFLSFLPTIIRFICAFEQAHSS
jgi:hypothetical protein